MTKKVQDVKLPELSAGLMQDVSGNLYLRVSLVSGSVKLKGKDVPFSVSPNADGMALIVEMGEGKQHIQYKLGVRQLLTVLADEYGRRHG